MKKVIEKKYFEILKGFEKGYITKEEAMLYIYLGEGKITKKEFDFWFKKINNNKLGHPKYIEFENKFKTLIDYYNKGNCTLQQMFETIEILEKFELRQL